MRECHGASTQHGIQTNQQILSNWSNHILWHWRNASMWLLFGRDYEALAPKH